VRDRTCLPIRRSPDDGFATADTVALNPPNGHGFSVNDGLKILRPSLRVDLIVPARNEAACLPALFAALVPVHRGGPRLRVILADNDSTDGTARIAADHGAVVVHEPRRGYGAACLAALAWIREGREPPEIVTFLDADLSDDPKGLLTLIGCIEQRQADLVIGSRPRHAEPGALTLPQRFGNRLACTVIRGVTGVRFTDLGPMRAVRWSALESLDMSDTTWGWTLEMQFKAALLGLRCEEIDVAYRHRHAGRSKISGSITGSIRAGTKILSTLGTIWWQWRRR